MKKLFVVLALTTVIASFNLFAKSGYDAGNTITDKSTKALYVGGKGFKGAKKTNKGVGVVGKIKVIYDGNMDFLLQTRNAKENELLGDRYSFEGSPEKDYYNADEIFCNLIAFTKNTRDVVISNLSTDNEYFFHSDKRLALYLPTNFKFTVPEDEHFAYIGTIVYHFTGDDFTLKSIEVIDEYDEAQEEFNKLAKTDEYRLCRVQLSSF